MTVWAARRGRIRARTTSTISSIAAGCRVGVSAPARIRARSRRLPTSRFEPVRLLEDRRQQLSLLLGVMVHGGVQEARHAGLDRCERGSQVVRDRREHGGAQLVRLGVELRDPRARVQPRAVERGGGLARRRLQEQLVVAMERPAAVGALATSVPIDTSPANRGTVVRGPPDVLAVRLARRRGGPSRRGSPRPRPVTARTAARRQPARTRRGPDPGPLSCAACWRASRRNRASRSRREARARSSLACPTSSPTPSATERKTTPVATSSMSLKRNVSCGSSTTSGRIVEARIPAIRPAHSPPATAAITTASRNSAIEISGRARASGKATRWRSRG